MATPLGDNPGSFTLHVGVGGLEGKPEGDQRSNIAPEGRSTR
jgi:hypothetical protein